MKEGRFTSFNVHCSGTFRVVSACGQDVTPTSQRLCAILAYLINQPDFSASRATLQTLLWGDKEDAKASGSLRSTIFLLKDEIKGAGFDGIHSFKHHISLDPEIWKLHGSEERGVFMHGFDLRIVGAELFEDWLLSERQKYDPGEIPSKQPSTLIARRTRVEVAVSLGLLPTEIQGPLSVDNSIVVRAIDELTFAISQISMVPVYDLRGRTLDPGALKIPDLASGSYLLRSAVFQHSQRMFLRLSLLEARSGKVLRSFRPLLLENESLDLLVAHAAQMILETMTVEAGNHVPSNLLPWAVLSSLFSLSNGAVVATENEIDRLLETETMPVLNCLRIFLQVFKANEGISPPSPLTEGDMHKALSAIPTSDPLRPLCESLVGYAAHMLHANNEFSLLMLKTAEKRSPNLALNLDNLAALYLARGDLKLASRAHQSCLDVSALSSWRYSYEITGAMISLAKGDYREALRLSNQSLMTSPKFVGGLRYAMISFAMNNSEGDARLMHRRIRQLRPNYDLGHWVENFLRRMEPKLGNNVAITLENYDLI